MLHLATCLFQVQLEYKLWCVEWSFFQVLMYWIAMKAMNLQVSQVKSLQFFSGKNFTWLKTPKQVQPLSSSLKFRLWKSNFISDRFTYRENTKTRKQWMHLLREGFLWKICTSGKVVKILLLKKGSLFLRNVKHWLWQSPLFCQLPHQVNFIAWTFATENDMNLKDVLKLLQQSIVHILSKVYCMFLV